MIRTICYNRKLIFLISLAEIELMNCSIINLVKISNLIFLAKYDLPDDGGGGWVGVKIVSFSAPKNVQV